MSIPEFLIEKLQAQYGEKSKEIIEGYNQKRLTTFRVNTIKSSAFEVEEKLEKLNIEYEHPKWSKEAIIIKNVREDEIQKLDFYENGEIYLQSLSSMLPPISLQPKEEADILDMAAAPGGKTTQLAALSNNKANITACEMNKIRIEKLKYNVEKQGATCVYIMQKDSRTMDDFLKFDQILLDAPCSGSGTLEGNGNNEHFTEKLIEKSVKTQTTLLKKALKILKPGGELIYSTCSILSEENEKVVQTALKGSGASLDSIDFPGIEELPVLPTTLEGTLCILPNKLYEGFFIAKIKK